MKLVTYMFVNVGAQFSNEVIKIAFTSSWVQFGSRIDRYFGRL